MTAYELDLRFETSLTEVGSEDNAGELESEEERRAVGSSLGLGGARGEEPFLLACCSRATVCRFIHVKTAICCGCATLRRAGRNAVSRLVSSLREVLLPHAVCALAFTLQPRYRICRKVVTEGIHVFPEGIARAFEGIIMQSRSVLQPHRKLI